MKLKNELAPLATAKVCARLFREDCVTGMPKRLEPGSVDVVVTSPPYNLGVKYASYEDTLARADYVAWLGSWAESVKKVLAPGGSVFLNIGSKPTDPWVPFEVAAEMRKHFQLQNVLHWVKSIAIDAGASPGVEAGLAVGHFKPLQSERFVNDVHEYVFHLTLAGDVKVDRLALGVPYTDPTNARRWANGASGTRCRGNVWYSPYKTIRSRDQQRPHPATFPVELARKCILLHGVERTRTVLDPFLGIGHAGVAAAALGKDFVGFEIDQGYLAEAAANIRDAGAAVATKVRIRGKH